jgi:hypothetical protein
VAAIRSLGDGVGEAAAEGVDIALVSSGFDNRE